MILCDRIYFIIAVIRLLFKCLCAVFEYAAKILLIKNGRCDIIIWKI